MTAIRETLARAMPRNFVLQSDINSGSFTFHITLTDVHIHQIVTEILRALATWEPSDAVVDAACKDWFRDVFGVGYTYGDRERSDMRLTLKVCLRAMAEEGT